MWCKLAFYSSSLNLQPVCVGMCVGAHACMCARVIYTCVCTYVCVKRIPTVKGATFLFVSLTRLLMPPLSHKSTFLV